MIAYNNNIIIKKNQVLPYGDAIIKYINDPFSPNPLINQTNNQNNYF